MDDETMPLRKSDLYLPDLFAYLWRRPALIATYAAIGLVLAILYLHFAKYEYTIQLQVGPVKTSGSGRGGSLSSQLGDLASMVPIAGLAVGASADSPDFKLYMEGMFSRSIADALANRTDLMKVIFKTEWNASEQRWEEPHGIVRNIVSGLKYILGIPITPWSPPDGARLQEYIQKNVMIDQNLRNVLVTISFEHEDPDFGRRFLTALHQADDDHLRKATLVRSEAYIKYLSAKLATITVAEHRQALADSLSEQEKSMMMASGGASFSAEPFGGASASIRPTSPLPIVVLSMGVFLGVLAGLASAFLNDMYGAGWWRLGRRKSAKKPPA